MMPNWTLMAEGRGSIGAGEDLTVKAIANATIYILTKVVPYEKMPIHD